MNVTVAGKVYGVPMGRKLEVVLMTGLLAVASFAPSAQGSVLSNGNFTTTSGTFAAAGGGINTLKSDGVTGDYTAGGNIASWTVEDVGTATGLALLYTAGNQGNTSTANEGIVLNGRFGNFSVYDPGNVVGGTGGAIPNTSPGGGNVVVADGAVGYQVAIYQTLTSLNPGTVYAVNFWYAAGQQYGFTGTTTEGWQVSLSSTAQLTQTAANGTTIQDTPAQANGGLAQGAFQGWAQQTFNFTASGSTQVLTFLSLGTPSGQPPVDFLSAVTVSAAPEPGSMALIGGGLLSLAGLVRLRRKRSLVE